MKALIDEYQQIDRVRPYLGLHLSMYNFDSWRDILALSDPCLADSGDEVRDE